MSRVEHVLIRENFCRIECVREAMSNRGSASGRRTKADVLRVPSFLLSVLVAPILCFKSFLSAVYADTS